GGDRDVLQDRLPLLQQHLSHDAPPWVAAAPVSGTTAKRPSAGSRPLHSKRRTIARSTRPYPGETRPSSRKPRVPSGRHTGSTGKVGPREEKRVGVPAAPPIAAQPGARWKNHSTRCSPLPSRRSSTTKRPVRLFRRTIRRCTTGSGRRA